MATATQDLGPASDLLVQERGADTQHEYRCECGHVLHVSGSGRHKVYFEQRDILLDDPVMNRVCPSCGRILPGKNRP